MAVCTTTFGDHPGSRCAWPSLGWHCPRGGGATFTYDVEDTIGHAVLATGIPDVPSSACSPMDAAISCASPVDAVAAPTPLTLTTSAAPTGS